ncbi:TetR/AcrR family transcriptional regulator [Bacillus cereus]|uniref:TetR/AcrR family transcriptional regulator n=2 Tax=Bacillus cereus group TaxID=86661 RepID=A0A5B9HVN0_BACCE|nr:MULTISPECIES: TetR/AcrR family transcriptional regulator [Bacillus cereus group]MEC2713952.1 TetR/AcrR family transcriptional regulator [Bacillus cereus]MEC2744528.1 TetR/AcrR family transcriptional regulator [Bacillus cereus]MEC2755570.1 TetR/AcrR family transcriptional regulator [Bacillus cereus]MEC2826452.1 TetR/AcrR family transcriptional regulator [Bacillus cereus]MEC3471221.1 TetR/AcrR family transcriptional regulator [Bacillus tropicus]
MNKRGRPREFDYSSIVDVAMKTFWLRGYEGCSTQDLCSDTGLGKGSLYNTFGSKHELYKQVLERYHEIGIREQRKLLATPIPVKERLSNFFEWALKEDFENIHQKGCLLINASIERAKNDLMVQEIFSKHVELLKQAIEAVMEEGLQTGEISKKQSAEELASLLLSSYYGFRVLNVSMQNRMLSEQVIKGTMESICGA